MPVIEQAKGILIAQTGCIPEEAFDMLRRASQRSNVPQSLPCCWSARPAI